MRPRRVLVAVAVRRSMPEETANRRTDLDGRYWPTDTQRPGETVTEWCRRIDTYTNVLRVPA